jgi:hypothetical protein
MKFNVVKYSNGEVVIFWENEGTLKRGEIKCRAHEAAGLQHSIAASLGNQRALAIGDANAQKGIAY